MDQDYIKISLFEIMCLDSGYHQCSELVITEETLISDLKLHSSLLVS